MKIYSVFLLNGTSVEPFVQHFDINSLIRALPKPLDNFKSRILNAANEGAGHYGLGHANGGEVHMVVFEFQSAISFRTVVIITGFLGFLLFLTMRAITS